LLVDVVLDACSVKVTNLDAELEKLQAQIVVFSEAVELLKKELVLFREIECV